MLLSLLRILPFLFGGHRQLALENLALHHQVAVYKRTVGRPRLRTTDRLFWVGLTKVWAGWRPSLVFVTPDTVLRWQRRRFRKHWAKLSGRPTVGRPPVSAETIALVRKMAAANPLWGAPRIHGEILKLGIDISERTVSRLTRKRRRPPSQTWRTFLATTSRALFRSTSSPFPPLACVCSLSWWSLPAIGVGSCTSTSPSIPLLLGLLSKSWTPSLMTAPPPISSVIVMRSTRAPSVDV
jgi:hypothetical protein